MRKKYTISEEYKLFRLKLSRNFIKIIKQINKIPLILFVLSICLFVMILYSNFFLKRLPVSGEWPVKLELKGSLHTKQDNKIIAVSNAIVEIGGYKCTTNSNGEYDLKFVSKNLVDIPVIIKKNDLSGDNVQIIRVSFGSKEFIKQGDYSIK